MGKSVFYLNKVWYQIRNWESWHYHLKYIPIAPVWVWYCLKAHSVWFFTASNPSITFGGFEGEGKMEIYHQLPSDRFPKSIYVHHDDALCNVVNAVSKSGLSFPFVAKPDVGAMGYLFRKINSPDDLKKYHAFINEDYIIQDWVDYPVELSVFYYRMPDSEKGVISGLLMKTPPSVEGDGRSTLRELIYNNKILRNNFENISKRHTQVLDEVLPRGKELILSNAANRSQGAKLVNLNDKIDDRLTGIFDSLSLHSDGFYYGRFDVKCESLASLKQGRNFSVLEYNGAGAGIQHIYGNGLTLYDACRTIVRHWEKLYQISRFNNRERNVSYWKFSDGRKFLADAMKHLRKLKAMDKQLPV